MPTFTQLIQDIFRELNTLRYNPTAFSIRMESLLLSIKDNHALHRHHAVPVILSEGRSVIEEAIDSLKKTEPLPSLELSKGLSNAAQSHANDTGDKGIVGHIGSNESTIQERLEKFGKWSKCIAEGLDYGSMTGFEVVCSFLIDDGLPQRPHREALLNPRFKKVGIGAGPHTDFKSMAVVVLAEEYEENENLTGIQPPTGGIDETPEIDDWEEGAVKLTCEIREESDGEISRRKIKKIWEMADGTTKVTETIEQI